MKTNGNVQLFPVLRLVLFLVIGILLGDALYGVVSVYVWYVIFLCLLVAAFFMDKQCILQSLMIYCCMILFGGCLTVYKLNTVVADFPDDKMEYEAVIVSSPDISKKIVKCDIAIVDRSRPLKVKASFLRDKYSECLRVGDGVHVYSVLKEPCDFSGSYFDYRRYLLNHEYSATTFIYTDNWYYDSVDLSILSLFERLKISALRYRDKLSARFRMLDIGSQDYAVLAAMTLGERMSMSEEMIDDYSVSGALHVLSLSGMHLSIIYVMLMLLFMKRRRLVLAQTLIICVIWTYVVIVGLPVTAIRSAIMLTVYSFVCLLNRSNVSLNTLAVSAMIVLMNNPLSFYDVGFQMSFVSVLFIIIFYKPLYGIIPLRFRNIIILRYIWSMSVVSIAAQLGVAPLVAFYFGRFSCYFLVTNFIVVPASSVILYGVVLMFLTDWWPWLQYVLSKILSIIVKFMNESVSYIASLPGSSIDNIKINLIQVLMFYISVFAFYVFLVYAGKILWVYKMKS